MSRRRRQTNCGDSRPCPARIAMFGAILGLAALSSSLTGCNAVRQAPADWKYAETAVVDWVADVVGYQPPEY